MSLWNFVGLATPWNTVYYKDVMYMSDKRLRQHELKHIEQMSRDGTVKYLMMYNYYWFTRGYWNNPYEIEAREAEKEEI